MLTTSGAARWLRFGPLFALLLLPQFLITCFPAVGNFRQELPELLYLLLCPEMNRHAPTCSRFRLRNFTSLDIAAQSHGSNAKFLSRLISRKGLHSDEI